MEDEIDEYEVIKLVGDLYLLVEDLGEPAHIRSHNPLKRIIGLDNHWYRTEFSEGPLSVEITEWKHGMAFSNFLDTIYVSFEGRVVYRANVHRTYVDIQRDIFLSSDKEWVGFISQLVERYQEQYI